jgi:hypothetical protein
LRRVVSARTYPEGGTRAWLVVLGCFCGIMASFGFMATSKSTMIGIGRSDCLQLVFFRNISPPTSSRNTEKAWLDGSSVFTYSSLSSADCRLGQFLMSTVRDCLSLPEAFAWCWDSS